MASKKIKATAASSSRSPSVNIPDNVISEILPRLPVESLLRFKCVSKQWNSIISDPSFFKLPDAQGLTLIVCDYEGEDHRGLLKYYPISDEQALLAVAEDRLDEYITPIICREQDLMVMPPRVHPITRVLGSCHGLVIFSLDKHIYFWNPSTRYCVKVLELTELGETHYSLVTSGILHDSSVDDYKVAVVLHDIGGGNGDFIGFTLLKEKIWQRIHLDNDIDDAVDEDDVDEDDVDDDDVDDDDVAADVGAFGVDDVDDDDVDDDDVAADVGAFGVDDVDDDDVDDDDVAADVGAFGVDDNYGPVFYRGPVVNDRIHWLIEVPGADDQIAYFDFKSNANGILPMPRDNANRGYNALGLSDGCLCLFCPCGGWHSEVRVMTRYGDADSWTLKFNLNVADLGGGMITSAAFLTRRSGHEANCLISTSEGSVFVYNAESQDCTQVHESSRIEEGPYQEDREGPDTLITRSTCMKSLVSLTPYRWN